LVVVAVLVVLVVVVVPHPAAVSQKLIREDMLAVKKCSKHAQIFHIKVKATLAHISVIFLITAI